MTNLDPQVSRECHWVVVLDLVVFIETKQKYHPYLDICELTKINSTTQSFKIALSLTTTRIMGRCYWFFGTTRCNSISESITMTCMEIQNPLVVAKNQWQQPTILVANNINIDF